MNRKQSHEPIGSYGSYYNQRSQYQATSPYIDLLQSKKGVYGHRYDTKNVRSYTNYVKPSPASITSIFNQKPKPFKSTSNQKQKVKASSFTNQKKKRTRTQQAEQKMHQSMCIYPTISDKNNQQHASKSLFYVDQKNTNTQFQPNAYFQQIATHNKRKRHLSQNKHNYSQQVSNTNNNNHNNHNHNLKTNLLQNLQITDIDSLINLIDNCTSQANQYIAYLSQKMNSMKQQLTSCKAQINQLQHIINKKNLEISQKQDTIKQINRKISDSSAYKKQNGFQVKNLLQIIQKLSQENQRLRTQLQQYKSTKIHNRSSQQHNEKMQEKQIGGIQKQKQRQRQKLKDPRQRDYYNQIHPKIDILNISIDNNNGCLHGNSPSEAKQKEKQEKIDRDTAKKYKFIKAKGR